MKPRPEPPPDVLESIDGVALATIVGGGLLKNTDISRQGWSFPAGVPVPKESTLSVRTNYGSCVDNKVQQLCTGTGPNAGQCKIDAANSCWREIKDKE